MKYTLDSGKTINIPDRDIQRSCKSLNLSHDEAVKMWLEDEGYLNNEEQEKLVQATKGQRHYEKSSTTKTKRSRTVKVDDDKVKIIEIVAAALESLEGFEVTVTNKQKVIEIVKGDDTFKLDLIKKRKPKES